MHPHPSSRLPPPSKSARILAGKSSRLQRVFNFLHNTHIYKIFTLSNLANIELQRKQILTYAFLITGSFTGICFSIINYANNELNVIIVDLLLIMAAGILFPFIKYEKTFRLVSHLLLSCFLVIIIVLLFISYENQFYVLWLFTTPPVLIFLLGNKRGTFISLVLLSCFLLLYSFWNNYYQLSETMFVRVIFVYAIILLLILIYEHTRKTVQTALETHRKLLDETIAKLDRQQVQYIKIMKNVTDGIFLLDQQLNIKYPYSTALKEILGIPFITLSSSFIKVLETKIFKAKSIQLESYLNAIIHTGKLAPDAINPLASVTLYVQNQNERKQKTLAFSFSVIPLKKNKIEILGKVVDITQEVALKKHLAEQKNQKIQAIEQILAIMQVDPIDLKKFIANASNKLNMFKAWLQETCHTYTLHKELALQSTTNAQMTFIPKLFAELHAIKGNASVIGFIHFAETVHYAETRLKLLQQQPKETIGAFLARHQNMITQLLKKMLQELQLTENNIHKLGEFNYRYTQLSKKFDTNIDKLLERAIQFSRKPNHPPILLNSTNFHEHHLLHNAELYESIKDCFILLVKNSLSHGIKTNMDSFCITIASKLHDHILTISYCDNGKGIDPALVKTQLKNAHGYTETQLNAMSHQETLACIFKANFSTAQQVSLNAGQGLGMNFKLLSQN